LWSGRLYPKTPDGGVWWANPDEIKNLQEWFAAARARLKGG
jgi:hypothetical protein